MKKYSRGYQKPPFLFYNINETGGAAGDGGEKVRLRTLQLWKMKGGCPEICQEEGGGAPLEKRRLQESKNRAICLQDLSKSHICTGQIPFLVATPYRAA